MKPKIKMKETLRSRGLRWGAMGRPLCSQLLITYCTTGAESGETGILHPPRMWGAHLGSGVWAWAQMPQTLHLRPRISGKVIGFYLSNTNKQQAAADRASLWLLHNCHKPMIICLSRRFCSSTMFYLCNGNFWDIWKTFRAIGWLFLRSWVLLINCTSPSRYLYCVNFLLWTNSTYKWRSLSKIVVASVHECPEDPGENEFQTPRTPDRMSKSPGQVAPHLSNSVL